MEHPPYDRQRLKEVFAGARALTASDRQAARRGRHGQGVPGLTIDEAATALEISPATVEREWALAKAWLYRQLSSRA